MYILIGVIVVILFWNFLFVIMVGIIVVLIVIGNIVVLKFVSVIFVIVVKFVEVFEEFGLLKGVVNFVSGSGVEVGDYFVDYLKISFIIFMGLREVGMRIFECVVKV